MMPISESERTRGEDPKASIANFRANMHRLGFGLPSPAGAAAVRSPSTGGMFDWFDFPQVVAAYAHTFPHNGPMDRRNQDWEDQTYPNPNPRSKRPKGPGESVIMS
jgi:hypothetical protein